MAEPYNVRSNGQRYYVFRIDGNVQVAEYFDGASAQRDCAIRNMRQNEQMAKKKESDLRQEVLDKAIEVGKSLSEKEKNPPPGQGVSY